ncbi:MAG: hypothetical protein EBR82_20215 [Caulobacteraceae bacterium]|nr:hypothetical protein [Caulobacteraceae bacterium]
MQNLFRNVLAVHVAPNDSATTTYTLAAGTTTVNSVGVDTQGYKGAQFLVTFGTNVDTAVAAFKVQGSADNSTGWTDISNATQTNTDASGASSNKMLAISVEGPLFRYIRLVTTRTVANTALNALHCLLDDNVRGPVDQLTTAGQFVAQPTYVSTI